MSVPFLPRSPAPPTQMFRAIFQDRFFYILYFQEPGVAEAELEADVRRSLRLFIYGASADGRNNPGFATAFANKPKDARLFDGAPEITGLPAWLTEEDLDVYVRAFEKSGFRGPLNRYRCMDLDWEQLPELAGAQVRQPALFISGKQDPVATFAPMDPMKEGVPNLKTVLLDGCGHWTQQEKPREVNEAILEFLHGL